MIEINSKFAHCADDGWALLSRILKVNQFLRVGEGVRVVLNVVPQTDAVSLLFRLALDSGLNDGQYEIRLMPDIGDVLLGMPKLSIPLI